MLVEWICARLKTDPSIFKKNLILEYFVLLSPLTTL